MKKNKKKKKEKKKRKKKKKKKLERPNPDFRVHQSPRGPGASPFFYKQLIFGFLLIVEYFCCIWFLFLFYGKFNMNKQKY